MRRTRLRFHALPAILVVALSLALPVVANPDDETKGSHASVTMTAAQSGGPGGDQTFPIGSGDFEKARNMALAHWGAQPCGGTYEVVWTPLDMGTNATASWRNPTDAWHNAGENFDCRIDMNPHADYDYAKLCTVLAHEIGHLLGQQHDPNHGQLMSAYYSTALPECEAGQPAPPVPATPVVDEELEDVQSTAGEPRRTLRKKTTVKTKKVKRCVMRYKAGKRVKRCFMVKVKVTAKKATGTKAQKGAAAKKAAVAKKSPTARKASAGPVAVHTHTH